MTEDRSTGAARVVGGVDTHKLHVSAVVDERDQVLGTRCFASTRQGYRQMLQWMRSFGELMRVGVECTGSYGAGLLRHLQAAGVPVLEVTAPDRQDRRRRGKDDDIDAQNAAHAAFAGKRTVTPKTRDGMIESLRVLKACRKTAVAARRVSLQMIHNTPGGNLALSCWRWPATASVHGRGSVPTLSRPFEPRNQSPKAVARPPMLDMREASSRRSLVLDVPRGEVGLHVLLEIRPVHPPSGQNSVCSCNPRCAARDAHALLVCTFGLSLSKPFVHSTSTRAKVVSVDHPPVSRLPARIGPAAPA